MIQRTYTIEIHEAEEGETGFWVSVPSLPGCFSQGDTYEAAVANAREAVECDLEELVKEILKQAGLTEEGFRALP